MVSDILVSNSIEILESHIVECEVWTIVPVNFDILKDSKRFGIED